MKKQYLYLIAILAFTFSSCNTYQWQRKRYYQKDPKKNWNHYKTENKPKSKN